jgi:signal transduction histidine kinase
MKGLRNSRYFLPILMISSQLLLTAFVAYWLMGQYREEKALLHSELKKEYFQVQDQLVDSMLMEHLVMPSLDDSMKIIVHSQELMGEGIWLEGDTTVVKMRQAEGDLAGEIQLEHFHLDAALDHDSGLRSIDLTSVISEEERMVRSVKLFINKNPGTFRSDTGTNFFTMQLDSGSLILNMELALEKNKWPFSLDWPSEDLSKAEFTEKRGILVLGGIHSQAPPLLAEHFRAYLIQGIFPQILFALVLLLLSASAFVFTYRSLLRQQTLNKLRDDFIGNISHELKTPVSTVKIALEALQTYDMRKDPKVAGEYLAMAGKELLRLENLVGKVLDHQMLDKPSLHLEKESCDLGELTRSVLLTLDVLIRERGAQVNIKEEDGPCSVLADRIYVESMILNLVDNSLKYTGDKPLISILINCTPSHIRLSVTDNGPGIPEEYKNQIFEKFFRIPDGNRHNVKGHGLGLNFASQVMAQHGGSISFSNLAEGGCRFSLEFPREKL